MPSYKLYILSKESCPYCKDLKRNLDVSKIVIPVEFIDVLHSDDDESPLLDSIPPYHSVPHIILAKSKDGSEDSFLFVAALPDDSNRDEQSLNRFIQEHQSSSSSKLSRRKRLHRRRRHRRFISKR